MGFVKRFIGSEVEIQVFACRENDVSMVVKEGNGVTKVKNHLVFG